MNYYGTLINFNLYVLQLQNALVILVFYLCNYKEPPEGDNVLQCDTEMRVSL